MATSSNRDGRDARHRRGRFAQLKEKGYKVAANYAGNDERARSLHEETGIPSYKWDVADLRRLRRGGRPQIDKDLGRSKSWSTTPASRATRRCAR